MPAARELLKRIAAHGLTACGVAQALLALQVRSLGRRFIRVLAYHGTPPEHEGQLARQFEFLARTFRGVLPDDLEGLISRGEWPHEKPGLIVSFDDGLRSNFDVAAPRLEEHGFVGWFFVPTGFIDSSPGRQVAYADEHQIDTRRGSYPDGRIAMSWDELSDLERRGHVVGCHTHSHWRMVPSTTAADLELEIDHSKLILQGKLGHRVDSFCWVGGEEDTYSAVAMERIRQAGYRYAFAACSEPVVPGTDPLWLQRTHLEAEWPISLVRLQISGITDRANAAKRARIAAEILGRSA